MAIAGDTIEINKAFALYLALFLEYHNHCYFMATNDIISDYSEVIYKIQQLIEKLSYHIQAAKLSLRKHLTAKTAKNAMELNLFNDEKI